MGYIKRLIEDKIRKALDRGKSILLLGPRQTGKTTIVEHIFKPEISYSFVKAKTRYRYEKDLPLFEQELEYEIKKYSKKPLIFIDEVQKIPPVMDVVQGLIDKGKAQFILTGSSVRKLKHGCELNLIPGRVVALSLAPLVYKELPDPKPSVNEILLYGTLPNIITESEEVREEDLHSYIATYLEKEIQAEAAIRNVGYYARFLELSAGEAGKQLNLTKISQDVGVAVGTITHYFQILEDSLIAIRIDPITNGRSKRRLIKSPKYLYFDLGVRRACANEGLRLPLSVMGDLLEHYIGIELTRYAAITSPSTKVRYWRDSAGPEVDFILDMAKRYVPIEVKWTDAPKLQDAKHLEKFLDEYPEAENGYVVCRTPKAYQITKRVVALPWQDLDTLFEI